MNNNCSICANSTYIPKYYVVQSLQPIRLIETPILTEKEILELGNTPLEHVVESHYDKNSKKIVLHTHVTFDSTQQHIEMISSVFHERVFKNITIDSIEIHLISDQHYSELLSTVKKAMTSRSVNLAEKMSLSKKSKSMRLRSQSLGSKPLFSPRKATHQ